MSDKIIYWDDIPFRFQRKNNVIFEINMLIIDILQDTELSLNDKLILIRKVRKCFMFQSLLLGVKKHVCE